MSRAYPVAWRIDLNTDHKPFAREWSAMRDAAKRFETSGSIESTAVDWAAKLLRHNSGAVTADIDGVGNFERGII